MWRKNPLRNFQSIIYILTTNANFFNFFLFQQSSKKNGDHTVKRFLTDGCNLQHRLQKSKNDKIIVEFQILSNFFQSVQKSYVFVPSVHGKKKSVENAEKNGGKCQKTRKIGKIAADFSNFGKTFQSFRKSYGLLPSHGKRKWRRKFGEKKSFRKGFREIVGKTCKKSEFRGKKILWERSLRYFRICKKFGTQRYIRRNAVIRLNKIANKKKSLNVQFF